MRIPSGLVDPKFEHRGGSMPVIQGKPIEKDFTRDLQFHAAGSRGKDMAEADRARYLRIAAPPPAPSDNHSPYF
jgi:hypothetical protein